MLKIIYKTMQNFKTLKEQVIQWGLEKQINNPVTQFGKVSEELNEICDELTSKNGIILSKLKDAIGDTAVTLILLNHQEGRMSIFSEMKVLDVKDPLVAYRQLFIAIAQNDNRVFYMLNDLAEFFDTTLEECLSIAYNVISKRTGQTINGQFYKSSSTCR